MPASPAPVLFVPRERLILSLLCRGFSNKEIADELEISPKTARALLRNLYRKAGVSDDRQLILYTMQQPHAQQRGHQCQSGLHPPGVDVCPYCQAMRVAA